MSPRKQVGMCEGDAYESLKALSLAVAMVFIVTTTHAAMRITAQPAAGDPDSVSGSH